MHKWGMIECFKMYTILTLLFLAGTPFWAFSTGQRLPLLRHTHPQLPVVSENSLKINAEERTIDYWIQDAQKTVLERTSSTLNTNVAKNVILFLGDGMSVPTVSAARVFNGGEEAKLSFENFPYTGLSMTYAVDRQIPDSANTATAYLCGVKANYGTIGVGPEVPRSNCEAQANLTNYVHSIGFYSQLQNKRTGLVTTARVTHASPAGVYAHTSNRDWESDTDVLNTGSDPAICNDIASQVLKSETGRNLNVIFGGGKAKFIPNTHTDEQGNRGDRSDGANLISIWLGQRPGAQYIWNRDQLLDLEPDAENVLGLFAADHMDYNIDRDASVQPSLAEMTEAAINILNSGENGYFLFVEGARIDMAHHASEAQSALNETLEFSKAIQTAVDLTDEADTLIVVTADHAHTLSFSGYPVRGNDILEFGGRGSDDKVYTTLSYANGPGYQSPEPDGTRHDISKDDYEAPHYPYPALVPLAAETHGGDDVAIYARGPWAHLFSGVLEQNTIPHLMSYASCVGEGLTACNK